MGEKELISVRIEQDTKGRVDRYADDHGVSRSTAIRRLLEKGVDLEEAGLTVAASTQSEPPEKEEPMTDGGVIRLSDHPWIDPIIRAVDLSALIGLLLTFTSLLSVFVAVPLVESMGSVGLALWAGAFYALAILGTVMVFVALTGILILEYLMDPSEAPIRRYFHDNQHEIEATPV